MTELERRIIDISYQKKLSHIGSCLSSVQILADIFKQKLPRDKVVLSAGHCALALYVILEQYGHDAEGLFDRCGVHPDRIIAPEAIDCSTGSLGLGATISLGMALADRGRTVWCLISDGEAAEGSVYETMNIKEKYKVDNLKVYCNYNKFGAYDETNLEQLKRLPGLIIVDTSEHWFIKKYKQEAHYKALNEQEYQNILNEKDIL